MARANRMKVIDRLLLVAAVALSAGVSGCGSSAKPARFPESTHTEARRCINDWNNHAGAVAKYQVSVGLGTGELVEVGPGGLSSCEVMFELFDGSLPPLVFGWIYHDGVWVQPNKDITEVTSMADAHSIAGGDIAEGGRPALPSVPALGTTKSPFYSGGCVPIHVPGSAATLYITYRQVSCTEAVLITIAFVHQQAARFQSDTAKEPSSLNVEEWSCEVTERHTALVCQDTNSPNGFFGYVHFTR